MTKELLDKWSEGEYADDEALLLTKPLLKRQFRYLTKCCEFVLDSVAEEKSLCSFYGMCIPYFAPQAVDLNRQARRHAFPSPTSFWYDLQLP